jgi:hypothetical protein
MPGLDPGIHEGLRHRRNLLLLAANVVGISLGAASCARVAVVPEFGVKQFKNNNSIMRSSAGGRLVADKCQKCRGDLYCEACKEISKHRPFEKQAIEILLEKTRLPQQLIDDFFYVRNNLMHGEPRENIEASIQSRAPNFEFHKIIDCAGKTAWTVILNAFAKPPGEHRPQFLQVSTYVNWRRSVTAHIIIGVRGDPNNPKIEDLHLPTISLKPGPKENAAS